MPSLFRFNSDLDRRLVAELRQTWRQFARRIADIVRASMKPSVLKLDNYLDRHLLAGRVRSPTAASEHSSSQSLGFADRLLSGNRYGPFGSVAVLPT